VWVIGALVVAVAGAAAGIVAAERRRARAASEGTALRDLRRVLVAELRYSQLNAGHYDRIECLAAPARCLTRLPAAPALLDANAFADETRGDYHFVFHPGPPPARGTVDEKRVSPTSVAAFAYVAVPLTDQPRCRSFCADSTGRLCALVSPDAPELKDGVCPLACLDLR
jgi:hypothetical protein